MLLHFQPRFCSFLQTCRLVAAASSFIKLGPYLAVQSSLALTWLGGTHRKGHTLAEGDDPAAAQFKEPFFNFYDKRLMAGAWMSEPHPENAEMFWRLLAVCHTVIPDGPAELATIKYEAESPDEAALVVGAKAMGFFFFRRTNTCVYVRESTAAGVQDMQYEVLNVLEFNSTRKRMSVIVKDPSGKLLLFCKVRRPGGHVSSEGC